MSRMFLFFFLPFNEKKDKTPLELSILFWSIKDTTVGHSLQDQLFLSWNPFVQKKFIEHYTRFAVTIDSTLSELTMEKQTF